jgi:hypothetical protein
MSHIGSKHVIVIMIIENGHKNFRCQLYSRTPKGKPTTGTETDLLLRQHRSHKCACFMGPVS